MYPQADKRRKDLGKGCRRREVGRRRPPRRDRHARNDRRSVRAAQLPSARATTEPPAHKVAAAHADADAGETAAGTTAADRAWEDAGCCPVNRAPPTRSEGRSAIAPSPYRRGCSRVPARCRRISETEMGSCCRSDRRDVRPAHDCEATAAIRGDRSVADDRPCTAAGDVQALEPLRGEANCLQEGIPTENAESPIAGTGRSSAVGNRPTCRRTGSARFRAGNLQSPKSEREPAPRSREAEDPSTGTALDRVRPARAGSAHRPSWWRRTSSSSSG